MPPRPLSSFRRRSRRAGGMRMRFAVIVRDVWQILTRDTQAVRQIVPDREDDGSRLPHSRSAPALRRDGERAVVFTIDLLNLFVKRDLQPERVDDPPVIPQCFEARRLVVGRNQRSPPISSNSGVVKNTMSGGS